MTNEFEKNDGPLVSIIIPCYKQAEFLREAIESCLSQTYRNLEIIVVDDGSPDHTSLVASEYREIKLIRQENSGLRVARNRGLEESTGEFLIFLDSDDRLRPKAVELGMAHLIDRPRAAFAYGRCERINSAGEFIGPFPHPKIDNYYASMLLGNFMPSPAAIMFRREPAEQGGGFSPNMHGCEDYDICLRLGREHEVCAYDEVVADYRQHETSLSRRAVVMSNSVYNVLTAQIPFVRQNPEYNNSLELGFKNWRKKYYASALLMTISDKVHQKEFLAAAKDLVSLTKANPSLLFESATRKFNLEIQKLGKRRKPT
ncbi:MAG TPA: glycosyltransferase [Pyrinomonadaceae bacterium]|jgi:Glycosyltransferases involved in cell wall biogenesis|nr:glycosyltransferase [Pyrinomonadaceae bacterium]